MVEIRSLWAQRAPRLRLAYLYAQILASGRGAKQKNVTSKTIAHGAIGDVWTRVPMAAGISAKVWEVEELIALLDSN